ncbi:hypothetical protein A1Q2_07771 [Trichosporon asahii var. asahii CBS 8904]|uniref:Uncharacterized protein n=1 Tax=Trichosporon asahii var. asahii (strain CBS 8904) TaxID=1220162 RepID=K1V210_TRIAC|nr:hypothetical protein A1Q2_07771 [Trichosporon asahii var. asahii CBS 8904]
MHALTVDPDQVKVTVTDLNNQEVFFHVKRHHKVMKLKVLQRDALTFETIPNVQEDDLEEGLKLEMRTSRE